MAKFTPMSDSVKKFIIAGLDDVDKDTALETIRANERVQRSEYTIKLQKRTYFIKNGQIAGSRVEG